MKFSFNPFYILKELCGPKLCHRVMSCFFCTAIIGAVVFLSPFINTVSIVVSPFMEMKWFRHAIYIVLGLFGLCILWYCFIKPFCCACCYKEREDEPYNYGENDPLNQRGDEGDIEMTEAKKTSSRKKKAGSYINLDKVDDTKSKNNVASITA